VVPLKERPTYVRTAQATMVNKAAAICVNSRNCTGVGRVQTQNTVQKGVKRTPCIPSLLQVKPANVGADPGCYQHHAAKRHPAAVGAQPPLLQNAIFLGNVRQLSTNCKGSSGKKEAAEKGSILLSQMRCDVDSKKPTASSQTSDS
jgi:hypothetical protein